MNVQAIAVGAAGLSGVSTDALVVVLTPAHKAVAGDTALDRALQSAAKAGDLQIKPGQSLYLHGVEGVKAPRVLFVVARDASAKAFRAAVTAALSQKLSAPLSQPALSATRAAASALRSRHTTRAPASTAPRVTASPMPEAPPITIAVLPCKLKMLVAIVEKGVRLRTSAAC